MELDTNAVQRGRKKVFSAKQKLALVLPPNKKDGELEEGDLIYVMKRMPVDGKDVFKFKVIKFAESPREGTIYTSETKYFKPHYTEEQVNADGATDDTKDKEDKKVNLLVPSVTGLGLGTFAYFYAKRKGKNALMFGLGGTVLGGILGVLLYKMKK